MPDGVDPKKYKRAKVDASTASPSLKRSDIPASIGNQFDQTREYVNSPKYAQRLGRMINTEKKLVDTKFNSELLDAFKPETPSADIASAIVQRNNANLDTVADKISVGNFNLGKNVAGGYDSSYNDIRLNEDLLRQNPTVPAHELSHATNDGLAPYSSNFKKSYVDRIMVKPGNSMFEGEVQKPTEVKARLDAVRSLAQKEGLYNAGKEDFTPAHLQKLKNNPKIKNDFNFKQIIDQLDKDYKDNGFIWLMNNIAKNNTSNPLANLV